MDLLTWDSLFIPRLLYVLYKQLLHVCDTIYPHFFSAALPARHKLLWLCKIHAKNLLSLLKQNETGLKQTLSFWQHICTNKLCKCWCGNNRARQPSAALLRSCPQNVSNCNSCQHALKMKQEWVHLFTASPLCLLSMYSSWFQMLTVSSAESYFEKCNQSVAWCMEWHFLLPKACSRSKTEQEEGEGNLFPQGLNVVISNCQTHDTLLPLQSVFLYDATPIFIFFSWSKMTFIPNPT